jgi:protein involved in polysaccharide export with SLBB domain
LKRAVLALAAAALLAVPVRAQQEIPEDLARRLAEEEDFGPEYRETRRTLSRPVATLEGAVDPERYVLGPGDLLEVMYTGRANPSEEVRVSPSGRIHLAPTGPVAVAGLTLAEAEEKVKQVLARYYAQTKIGLDLLEVRSFRVHVLGLVPEPGAREVTAAHRVSDLFRPEIGGTPAYLPRSSRRNMVLRHSAGDEVAVDLVRYETLGDLDMNPFLEDGDVLHVPAKLDSVSVFGFVARPGFIEFRAGDTIDQLIAIAGGFDSGADKLNVELRRFEPESPDVATRRILNLEAGDGSLAAQPGDGVYIRANLEWRRERLVEIYGEIRYPGVYAIQEGTETLRDLVQRAGGFTPEADPSGTRVERPNVFDRPEEDPEFQRLQGIPISEMSDEEYEYLKLRSRQREGLASSTLSSGLDSEEAGESLVLRAGDRVFVPRKNLAVDVQGAVKNPGFVPYEETRRVRDYVELAGGISPKARTGSMRVIRHRTGEWVKADKNTTIDPGDAVWVPEKPDRDWWRITREAAIFFGSIATIVLVVDSVAN